MSAEVRNRRFRTRDPLNIALYVVSGLIVIMCASYFLVAYTG